MVDFSQGAVFKSGLSFVSKTFPLCFWTYSKAVDCCNYSQASRLSCNNNGHLHTGLIIVAHTILFSITFANLTRPDPNSTLTGILKKAVILHP